MDNINQEESTDNLNKSKSDRSREKLRNAIMLFTLMLALLVIATFWLSKRFSAPSDFDETMIVADPVSDDLNAKLQSDKSREALPENEKVSIVLSVDSIYDGNIHPLIDRNLLNPGVSSSAEALPDISVETGPGFLQDTSKLHDLNVPMTEAMVINYPNGNRYEGELKGDVLHGHGIYSFAVRTLVSKNDPMARYAQPGYYLIGQWHEGELYMGRLYDSKGVFQSRIIIGRN